MNFSQRKKGIFNKRVLLTQQEIADIGQDVNLVGYDPQLNLTSDDSIVVLKYGNPSSPKLLNWVEPYNIGGVEYTLFYTEVNSGLSKGDRVFIINGTYDSNLRIAQDMYKKGNDGYKVLYIDRCRVVLDIEFAGNGFLPSSETRVPNDDFDDFIKIYKISDQRDFIHVNRQITTQGEMGYRPVDFKFNLGNNNLIYTENDFMEITTWGETMGLTGAPGFFAKNDSDYWVNVTDQLLLNDLSLISATHSNGKLLIKNGSFTFSEKEFLINEVYKFDQEWMIEVKHENSNVPILTKSNFRNGEFHGTWNGGLYGSNDLRIHWNSPTAIWNHGTLLNTIWERGILNSLWSQTESYIAEFDSFGIPYQKSVNPDNDGYGYNFIINSELRNAVINNANVSNSSLNPEQSINILSEYVHGTLTNELLATSFNDTLVKKAYFESCDIYNSNIENSIVKNSRIDNSRLYNVKSINTHFKRSLFKNSNYISDNVIRVLEAKKFTFSEGIINTAQTHTVFKLYINKRSFERFKMKDSFYIKGVKSNTVKNFFDKRFKIGTWDEYADMYNNSNNEFFKLAQDYSAFLSSPYENSFEFALNTGVVETGIVPDGGYSIDIFTFGVNVNDYDFTEAYILNSDFESGLFENSNWNSGYHINSNFDLDITKYSNAGGEYAINIDSENRLVIDNITSVNYFTEIDIDSIKDGDVVFINSLEYDTRGSVASVALDSLSVGSGYTSINNISLDGEFGTGLVVNITANGIGGLEDFSIIEVGNGYIEGYATYSTTTSGSGSGVVLGIHVISGAPVEMEIIENGAGYQENDIIYINTDGILGELNVDSTTNGRITNIEIVQIGNGYIEGERIRITATQNNAFLFITGVYGSLVRLPDTYIVNFDTNMRLTEVVPLGGTAVIPTLTPGGRFLTSKAHNRYGYINQVKFHKSKILGGIFKRAYFNNSLIGSDSYQTNDAEFTNTDTIRSLMISNSIFSNTKNIIIGGLFNNSHFTFGNDIWDNGIVYNSTWDGLEFHNGLFKESAWYDGTFYNGLFYQSKSFNYNYPSFDYDVNNMQSYYTSGRTFNGSTYVFNNRYSWRGGTFSNGEFFKSDWENGTFLNGKLYYSKFYGGTIKGGIIGDESVGASNTAIYNGTIEYTTVENAEVVSKPIKANYVSTILWKNGVFNNGLYSTAPNTSNTWEYGIFNAGEFTNNAKWKDGVFNGGKFYSIFGYNALINLGVDIIENYSWEKGIFNGGEFGNANVMENSSWYYGEFNNGYFKGKVWNGGIFTFGEFIGSGATYSTIGGEGLPTSNGGVYSNNANEFTSSFAPFTTRYFGLWKDGFVTNVRNRFVDREIYTDLQRAVESDESNGYALFKNILWAGGTFSHTNGKIENSVWLKGAFENGEFNSSSFNPWVRRSMNNANRLFDTTNQTTWLNGNLVDSDFYYSDWLTGNFISGTAVGMVWKNGVSKYMNAFNIFWENGVWKNGNWEGSYFDLDDNGLISDDYAKTILLRGIDWKNDNAVHVWNLFYRDDLTSTTTAISNADSVSWNFDNTLNQPPTPPIVFQVGDLNYISIDSFAKTGTYQYTIHFFVSFETPEVRYELSSDGINWNSNTLAGITSPQNFTFYTGSTNFFIRLSAEFEGNTIKSAVLHFVNNIVQMPTSVTSAFSKTLADFENYATSYHILTTAMLFAGYSNNSGLNYQSVVIESLPDRGEITVMDVPITVPYTISASVIDATNAKFLPLGVDGDGVFESYTTTFTYRVYDIQGNTSELITANLVFTAF